MGGSLGVVVRVLGPLEMREGDRDVTPRGALQRRLLTALVLRHGRVVPVDVLADAMWLGHLPDDHAAALQTHVYRLRQRLPPGALEQRVPGYRLLLDDAQVDAVSFEARLSECSAMAVDAPARALELLDEALAWWRGEPYEDLLDDEARIERERLDELRRRAIEDRFGLLIELGRASGALADLESFVARNPLRERPRSLLMVALDASGRRAEALRVYDDYRRTLAEELGVSPSPALMSQHDQLLVAVPEPSAESDAGHESTERPTTPAATGPLLPRPPSALIGRDALLDDLCQSIVQHRVVTLLGAGGAGKTRLALEAAWRLRREMDDGVWFCDLSQVQGSGVATVLATTVGVEPRVDAELVGRVADALRHQDGLVVLDNCEHVLDDVSAAVECLIGSTEHLRIVATSRERLRVDGEVLCRVPPLDWDRSGAAERPGAAEALFAERARSVDRAFALDDTTLPVVTDICRRLDGLPLAIELAATRLHTMTLDEVRSGLHRRFALLAGGRRSVARHRSLAAALEWSYDLLDDTERHALDSLAVFAGPFDADDAAHVMGVEPVEALAHLADLGDRSLVHRAGDRFVLLETVRQFALERLDAAGRTADVRSRHTSRMAAAAERLWRWAREPDPGALPAFERSLPDLRAGFDHAMEAGDVDAALRIVVALRDCAFYSMSVEPLLWASRAVELARGSGHVVLADALAVAAIGSWATGDLASAERSVAEARQLVRASGAHTPFVLGDVSGTLALSQGRPAEALQHYERALEEASELGDPLYVAEDAVMVVAAMAYLGDPRARAAAHRLLHEVEPAAGAIGSVWCWYGAGEALVDVDPETARARLATAEASARAIGARFVVGVAGASIASIDTRRGALDDAITRYRWLLPHWIRAGLRTTFCTMLRSVADLLVRCDQDEPAAKLLGVVDTAVAGSHVFGADDERLTHTRATLRSRLGGGTFERLRSDGCRLDDAAAAAVAIAAFDEIGPPRSG